MPDLSLLDVVRPLLPAPPDPEAELARLLNGLLVPDPAPQAGTAVTRPGVRLDFAWLAGALSLRAAAAVPAGTGLRPGVWAWPDQVSYTLAAPLGQLERLDLSLGPLQVRLPFLRAALPGGPGLLPDLAEPEVHLLLGGASLAITPAAGGGLQGLLAPEFATARLEPVTVLAGELALLGFDFSAAIFTPGAGMETVAASGVRLYAQPPGIPALGLRAENQELTLHLGADPGVSGRFEVVQAGQAAPAAPFFLDDLRWFIQLQRNALAAFEVHGQVDFQAVVAGALGSALPGVQASASAFELSAAWEADEWRSRLSLGAGTTPEIGLVSARRNGSEAANRALEVLGLLATFGPLLSPAAPDPDRTPRAGDFVDLALSAALTAGLIQSGLLQVTGFTLHGAKLVTRRTAAGEYEAILMLDLQTDLEIQARIGALPLVSSTPGRPLRVRHQALGLRLDFGDDPDDPVFRAVFDPGQGYSLGISDPGLLKVPQPLGDILQVLGVRMARTNPLNLEVDLGLAADLGVVKVDRARLRIPLDPPGLPSLTALGARLNVAAVQGEGYLSINNLPDGTAEMAGRLDARLVPLGLRVAAGLKLAQITGPPAATGVLVTLQVEFPVPLPLYASGLGLYGLAGLFAMHYRRAENAAHPQPALDWFEHRAGGNPTQIEAWSPDVDHWAFGVGAVLGTLEGGFVINMNGMVVIEAPGPRLLIFMGARLLLPRPGTKDKTPGQLLAVIDISDTAIRIGLTAHYGIPPIYEVRVPVGAVFPYPPNADEFEVDLGRIRDPVTVKYLFLFRGSGYLMIHGSCIPDFPLGALHGFSVAVGAHAEIIWGYEDIGLYLKVAAGLDVGVSFKPFLLLGRMRLSGELHVFIAGLEVSAEAQVTVVQKPDNPLGFDYFVKAEVCGEIDLWIDSIEGCVTIELGDEPALPPAPPLVRAVSLHSRTPAHLAGSGADRDIDGSLGEAAREPGAATLVVPIDAIPVIQFEMAPRVDQVSADQWPFGEPPVNRPPLPASGWTRRGERFYRYTLRSVRLEGPVGEGEKPSVWWSRHAQPAGDDNDVQLALLNWTPHPAPQAALHTIHHERDVERRWGTVCLPVVEPTPVLWTFHQAALGLSKAGWRMTGMALPDPSGTTRSAPPPLLLHAREAWRTGDGLADALLTVTPARVLAPSALLPGRLLTAPYTPPGLQLAPDDPIFTPLVDEAVGLAFPAGLPLDDALRLSGAALVNVSLLVWALDTTMNDHFSLRALDAAGNDLPFDGFEVQVIQQASDWLPVGHPWYGRVEQALEQLLELDLSPAFLLTCDLPEGTAQIEMGLRDMDEPRHHDISEYPATFILLAAAGLPQAEYLRYTYDETDRKTTRSSLNGYLGSDPSRRALLAPETTYSVVVDYSVEIGEEVDPAKPENAQYQEARNSRNDLVRVKPVANQDPPEQRFTFRTDSLPPRRLDPWILTVQPGENEGFHFWGNPIQVIFSTNAARALYAAYKGSKLYGVARAASFRHAAGPPGDLKTEALLEPGEALTSLTAQPSAILPPFEDSLRLLLRVTDCLPEAHELPLVQEKWDLNLLLDPITAYIFDIEARDRDGRLVPPAEDGQPVRPLFRRSFRTSRYQNLEAMVADIAGTPARHRWLANPGPLVDLAGPAPAAPLAIHELDLELALRQAGWGDLSLPENPQVTVIWDGQSPPQPVAVLHDLPEPLWRWRDAPEVYKDPADPLQTASYRLVRQPWLELVEDGGPVVRRIVYTSGGGRCLVVLQANARGATLRLAVRRTRLLLLDGSDGQDNLPLASLPLNQAPWENV